jgi:TraX protein
MKQRTATAATLTLKQPSAEQAPALGKQLVVADGTIEALKWFALVLMVLDHVNKFLYAEKLPVMFELGRLVMPIFGFVLVYNLVRPDAMAKGVHVRMMKRLAIFGAAATPMFVVLVGWWPLNILFMLLLVVAIVYLVERGGRARVASAIALFVIGGAFVEFWWPAIASCLAAWAYCRQPTTKRLIVWALATASLAVINQNLWSLVALPIVLTAAQFKLDVPRTQWVFYAAYPLHLAVLLAVQHLR